MLVAAKSDHRGPRWLPFALLLACRAGAADPGSPDPGGPTDLQPAKNVIVILGDGMGPAHVQAGRIFRMGPDQPLAFEDLAEHATFDTDSLSDGPTDSAAAATAFATGQRVPNRVLSLDADGQSLQTILERAAAAGKATGTITTSYVHDASPAAFIAHGPDRYEDEAVVADILSRSTPDLMFGGGQAMWNDLDAVSRAKDRGYTVVTTAEELAHHDTGLPILGLFQGQAIPTGDAIVDDVLAEAVATMLSPEVNRDGSETDPRLPQMTLAALELLGDDPDGLFLFVENEYPDELSHASGESQAHANALMPILVAEIALIDETVEAALQWASSQADPEDTLVIVMADHETCGLRLAPADYAKGDVVQASCEGGPVHTDADVGVWATGRGSSGLGWVRLNTDLYDVMAWALFGGE